MPRREKYVPKHRNAPAELAVKKHLRKSVTYSGVAVAATGLAVSGGTLLEEQSSSDPAATALSAARSAEAAQPVTEDPTGERGESVSRSAERTELDPAKAELLDQEPGGQVTRTADLTDQDPREIARALLPQFGFAPSEFSCLDRLYISESDWDPTADNPTSSAYGIPQALTGGTHDNLPADYMTNPVSQIEWGLWYIKDSYGTPCAAWNFKAAHGWY